jgi:hypothetical protein
MGDLWQKIQQRAYQLYLERGSKPGHVMEDWARAKNEIFSQKTTTETKAPLGQPVESLVFENIKQPQSIKKQEPYTAINAERKLQSVNSMN